MENHLKEQRLDELEPHQLCVVQRVEAPDDDLERLMAMGVCSGRTMEVVHPGDPMILKIFGSRIGVSARLAQRVWVERCAVEACPGNQADEQSEDQPLVGSE